MFRVYLLTQFGEVVYYEGPSYILAENAVRDFNSMAFEARIEEVN